MVPKSGRVDTIGSQAPHRERGKVDCNEVYERLSEYLDKDVREELARAIDEHRGHCPDCRVLIDTTRMTVVLYQRDSHMATPVAISQRLRIALSAAYRESESGRGDV